MLNVNEEKYLVKSKVCSVRYYNITIRVKF